MLSIQKRHHELVLVPPKHLPPTSAGHAARSRRDGVWSGREDLNLRPPAPKAGALPGCATPRPLWLVTARSQRATPSRGTLTLATAAHAVKASMLKTPECGAALAVWRVVARLPSWSLGHAHRHVLHRDAVPLLALMHREDRLAVRRAVVLAFGVKRRLAREACDEWRLATELTRPRSVHVHVKVRGGFNAPQAAARQVGVRGTLRGGA
jgi:hypothetical protein